MNASELADTVQWGRHLCRMIPEEADTIIKSLRFAADMERLWRECPNNVTVYHGGLQDTPAWITAGLFREKDSLAYVESGFHADIYAAARKAVEKLEGKSP